jgi:hypothetical protein
MKKVILLDSPAPHGGSNRSFVNESKIEHWVKNFPEGHTELYLTYWTSPSGPTEHAPYNTTIGLLSRYELTKGFSGGVMAVEQLDTAKHYIPCFFLLEDLV